MDINSFAIDLKLAGFRWIDNYPQSLRFLQFFFRKRKPCSILFGRQEQLYKNQIFRESVAISLTTGDVYLVAFGDSRYHLSNELYDSFLMGITRDNSGICLYQFQIKSEEKSNKKEDRLDNDIPFKNFKYLLSFR